MDVSVTYCHCRMGGARDGKGARVLAPGKILMVINCSLVTMHRLRQDAIY